MLTSDSEGLIFISVEIVSFDCRVIPACLANIFLKVEGLFTNIIVLVALPFRLSQVVKGKNVCLYVCTAKHDRKFYDYYYGVLSRKITSFLILTMPTRSC